MLHKKKNKKKQKKKKVTVAAITSFMKLLYNAASEEREEGDGNVAIVTCFTTLLQCSVAPQQSHLLLLRYNTTP